MRGGNGIVVYSCSCVSSFFLFLLFLSHVHCGALQVIIHVDRLRAYFLANVARKLKKDDIISL